MTASWVCTCRWRTPGATSSRVLVVVVAVVVGVPVVVRDGVVRVLVAVLLAQVQPRPDGHQRAGDEQLPGHRVTERDGQDGAEERGDREVRAGARGADVPQPDDEQHEAQPVGDEAEDQRGAGGAQRRELRAEHEREDEVRRTGDRALDRDEPGRVRQRDLAGQVVVERPARARPDDRERGPHAGDLRLRGRHGDDDGTGDDRGHPQDDAPARRLTEHDPGDHGRQDALGVEQQRRPRGRHRGQAEHQQHRAGDPAGGDGADEPRHLVAGEPDARRAADQPPDPHAQAGADVQQAGQQPRADLTEQELGQRRARTEQHGRQQGGADPGVPEAARGVAHGPMIPRARDAEHM